MRSMTRVKKPAVGKVASMPRPRVAKLPELPKLPKAGSAAGGAMKRGGAVAARSVR